MKTIDADRIQSMKAAAAEAARRRTHATLHDDLADPVQRVVIALQPGTYVRPHRHAEGVWELFAVLDGALAVLTFDHAGTVTRRVELRPGGDRMVQLPPGAWHSIAALAPDTLALEVKPGPYRPMDDKDFAAWAPAEGAEGAAELRAWLETAIAGATPPGR
ncbi:MAG: WbuC family cupin fold metalloprotein [Bacteroidales bacterium]